MAKIGGSIPVPVLLTFGVGALLVYAGITTDDSPVQIVKNVLSNSKGKSRTISADTISSVNGTAPDLAGVNAPINGVPAPLVAPAPSPVISPGGSIPGTRYQ